jgi:hypothetical protein
MLLESFHLVGLAGYRKVWCQGGWKEPSEKRPTVTFRLDSFFFPKDEEAL